jgi:hypothetical protein
LWFNGGLTGGATTTVTYAYVGFSTTADTLPTSNTNLTAKVYGGSALFSTANGIASATPPCQRININSTTTVRLVGKVGFATSTASGYGKIEVRRRR